jgi:hypothetical protein
MKTLVKLFFILLSMSLLMGCSKTDEFFEDSPELKKAKVMVKVPFKADFLGEYTSVTFNPDAECGEPFFCRVIVDYEGTATHLGKMYGTFEFCACGPADPDIEAPNNIYAGGETIFTAANGDMLFLVSEGSTVVQGKRPDHPEHVISWWQDNWVITGGTGRFEGATGSGTTDDYNSSLDPNSHHHWTGTITMIKGKR